MPPGSHVCDNHLNPKVTCPRLEVAATPQRRLHPHPHHCQRLHRCCAFPFHPLRVPPQVPRQYPLPLPCRTCVSRRVQACPGVMVQGCQWKYRSNLGNTAGVRRGRTERIVRAHRAFAFAAAISPAVRSSVSLISSNSAPPCMSVHEGYSHTFKNGCATKTNDEVWPKVRATQAC